MTHADRRSGAAAGKLQQTVQRLHATLNAFRDELKQSEDHYNVFEARWKQRDAEIAVHLDTIDAQLRQRPTTPTLSIVRADD